MFKERFKYYKRKLPVPDFSSVIDLGKSIQEVSAKIQQVDLTAPQNITEHFPGLEPVNKWLCYNLNTSGVIVIRNPFTVQGQRYWMARCLKDYSRSPNVNNLNPHLFPQEVLDDWWRSVQTCNDIDEIRRMNSSMRWATLGYHHDWDSKLYSDEKRGEFPKDLAALSAYFASALDFKFYEAQAAIVNFYPIGTTLSAHTDHSEPNRTAPLFSFSFGQTAIFLIGGRTKEVSPLAVYLHSGDVLVMSGESRLCYHAVPRVMKARYEPWNNILYTENTISTGSPSSKRARIEPILPDKVNTYSIDTILYRKVVDENFWLPFKNYLNNARININVRQVLNAGETRLPKLVQELDKKE